MAKEYLMVDGKVVLVDGELVQVPDEENLNDLADENGALATQSDEVANEIEDLIVKNGVIDGSPRGVYENLSALQTAFPTGAPGVYVTTDNGHWYYWNGTQYVDGGIYQSSEDINQIKEDLDNIAEFESPNLLKPISEQSNYNGLNFSMVGNKLTIVGTATNSITIYKNFWNNKNILKAGKYFFGAKCDNTINGGFILFTDDKKYISLNTLKEYSTDINIQTFFITVEENKEYNLEIYFYVTANKDKGYIEYGKRIVIGLQDDLVETNSIKNGSVTIEKFDTNISKTFDVLTTEPRISIPNTIYINKNNNHSVYYNNIILNSYLMKTNNFIMKVALYDSENNVIKNGVNCYPYKIDFTISNVGNYRLHIEIQELYAKEDRYIMGVHLSTRIVDSKDIMVVVTDTSTKSNENINVILLGDSFSDDFKVTEFAYINLDEIYNKVNFLGTRTSTISGVNDEAYGGWGYYNIISSQSQGDVINPFYNTNTNGFDFNYYMSNNHPTIKKHSESGEHLDYFLMMMGVNDVDWYDLQVNYGSYINRIKTIIDSVHSWDSDIKILVHTITRHNDDDAYFMRNSNLDVKVVNTSIERANKAVIDEFSSYHNVIIMDSCANYDTRYSIISKEYNPVKFDQSITERLACDVHPSEIGAKYIADTVTGYIVGN